MTALAPPVPHDLDLTDLPCMMLDIERLKKSKAWLRAKRNPALGFYLMNMWMRAFHEIPASSIENDPDVLADAAGCHPRDWAKVRADVMAGWLLCSDGRLYHPVVAEKALEALAKRIKYHHGKALARFRQAKSRAEQKNATIPTMPRVLETIQLSFPTAVPFLKQLQEFMPQDWMDAEASFTVTTPACHSDNTTSTPDCHAQNPLEGEGEGEGEAITSPGSAAGLVTMTVPMSEAGFDHFLTACKKTLGHGWSKPKSLHAWLRLPPTPPERMIAAWDLYLEASREKSKTGKFPQRLHLLQNWLHDRIFESYLETVEETDRKHHQRAVDRQSTITAWAGKAEPVIAAIGPDQFDAWLAGTTLEFTTTSTAVIHHPKEFHARYLRDNPKILTAIAKALHAEVTVDTEQRKTA